MVMPIGPRLLVVVRGLYLWQMFKTDSQTHRNRAGYGLWWAHGTIFWWRPRSRQGKVQFFGGSSKHDDVGTTSFAHRPGSGPTSGRCGAASGRRRLMTSARPTSERDVGPTSRFDVVVFTGPSKNCAFPWRDLGRHQKMVPWAHQSPYPARFQWV